MRMGTYLSLGLVWLAACDGSGAIGQRENPLGLEADVALLSASSAYCHDRCSSPDISALIRVKNLAFEKQIALVVRDPMGGPWTELGGWFGRQLDADYELWNVASFIGWQGDYEFAVKYTTGGGTYWDNNGGTNYLMHVTKLTTTDNTGGLIPSAVQLNTLPTSVAPAAKINGTVLVQDLATDKKVNVVYSADHWATTQTAAATFTTPRTLDGVETWSFTVDAPATPARIELAVSYDVAGTTYWDSFFGRNYTVDVK